MGCRGEALRLGDRQLVINPAVPREPLPRIGIFGRNADTEWTGYVLEILQAPRIGLANRHGSSSPKLRTQGCGREVTDLGNAIPLFWFPAIVLSNA